MTEEIPKAATVLALRDSRAGLEALFVRRSARLAFYGGAWVFPGGRIDPADGDAALGLEHAARNAGARELYEEAGVRVAPSSLVYVSRWVTPPGKSRRYDTLYFATAAQEAEVRVDREEIDDHRWLTAKEAMELRARGEIELPPPTFVTLCVLAQFGSVATACEGFALAPTSYVPILCEVRGGLAHLYEGDAGYDSADPSCEGCRHRLLTLGDDWRYEDSRLGPK